MLIGDRINILLIEDEEYDVRRVKNTLNPFRDRLIIEKVVADGQSALDILKKKKGHFDVVIMDYQIVGGITGETLIRKIKEIDLGLQIIVITKMTVNITDFEFANRLIEAGAMWYCTKYPGDIEDYIYQPTDFILSILNAYEKRRLEQEKQRSNKKLEESVDDILLDKIIIGESPAAKKMKMQIDKASRQDATILIYGASGTGKELVATHIHYLSSRRFEKFVTVNSGSLPSELIESEMFGFEKGSFTGAHKDKAGLFEMADHGTIFLDEIGELPPSSQVKLLRVLQDGELDKIGRTNKVKVDVRVIAATNIDLHQAIEEKKFREDLFYRLNVINIHIPALSERKEDIPVLFDHFLVKFCSKMSHGLPQINSAAMDMLINYEWPGNIRQLQNAVQRILFYCDQKITTVDIENSLSFRGRASDTGCTELFGEEILPWKSMEQSIKRKYFVYARGKAASDAEAARMLGLAPPNFYRMCKELGIK